jgi:hypothetical protein
VTSIGAVALLALIGAAGLLLAVSGWVQPVPPLSRVVRHLERDAPNGSASVPAVRGLVDRLAAALVQVVRGHPRLLPSGPDLTLLGRSAEQQVVALVVAGLAGAVIPPLVLGALQAFGVLGIGWFVPIALACGCAVAAPISVHTYAIERSATIRRDLRYQVSAYLDVVSMLLAGNSGYEGALDHAARAGDGRLFVELRRSLRESATRGTSLTEALRRVGSGLGLGELEQVAATAALSAAEGAPVARTLAAKCATLRVALAAEQETEARLRTSRLTTPIVGMALIFMGLVMYPALSFS